VLTAVRVLLSAIRPFDRFSFAGRLGLAISLLIASLCVTQSSILAHRDLQNVQRYLEERGRNVSEALARDGGPGLATGDIRALQQLAEQATTQPAVRYARFFDARGFLVASVGEAPTTAVQAPAGTGTSGSDPFVIGTETWEFRAPILSARPSLDEAVLMCPAVASDAPGGTVAVGISLEPLRAIRRRTIVTTTITTILFMLVAIVPATLLARVITRPLKALAMAADAIAHGELRARVAVAGDDEVGAVARSFNTMAGSVEQKVAELEEANRLKSEFLATISHELRTPLNVILGYVEMLQAGGNGTLSSEQAELVAAIGRYSQLQVDLITNVLDFARLASGRISLRVERFALAPLLRELRTLYAARLKNGTPRLGLTIDGRLPTLMTDRVKLQEILSNLLDNAVKFTVDGTISIRACRGDRKGWVLVTVSDTGPGIAPEDLPTIFDPFHQLGRGTTRGTGGVGLGLSIVKQLVEALGGTTSVSSRVGEGTVFRVDLPSILPDPTGWEDSIPSAVAALDAVSNNARKVPESTRRLERFRGLRRRRAAD
jgi:signal transduction histidine kinase